MSLPDPLSRLIEELVRLPGIGPKGAQRLAFHLLKTPREFTDRLIDALRDVKERVTYCSICNTITDTDPCAFCSSDARDPHVICVVEEPQNVTAIEKTPFFKTVRDHTVMGMFASPQHGGNYKKVGWTQIGYDDSLNFRAPFGAYDKAEGTW